MEKKKIKKILALGLFLVILAFYMEKADQVLDQGYNLDRKMPGEGDEEVSLILSPEDMDDIKLTVTVKEEILSARETRECIKKAKSEIDKTFCREDEELSHVSKGVNPKDSYADGLVEATWTFSSYEIVDSSGNIIKDKLSDEGEIVEVIVELSCNEMKELYQFSFVVYPQDKNEIEKLISKVKEEIDVRQDIDGTDKLALPKEIDGRALTWREPKKHMVIKILFLELIIFVLYFLSIEEKKRENLKKLKAEMELDYSEIVSKMAILMGSGMSIKQAWSRITARYLDEREKNSECYKAVYEEMLRTLREISDGEKEVQAYQNFGERVGINCYHRFSRILISSLQKGNREVCAVLEAEAEEAFEKRKLLARKLGEEASTKMLLPLMLMMIVVIAIVVAPAIVSFKS